MAGPRPSCRRISTGARRQARPRCGSTGPDGAPCRSRRCASPHPVPSRSGWRTGLRPTSFSVSLRAHQSRTYGVPQLKSGPLARTALSVYRPPFYLLGPQVQAPMPSGHGALRLGLYVGDEGRLCKSHDQICRIFHPTTLRPITWCPPLGRRDDLISQPACCILSKTSKSH